MLTLTFDIQSVEASGTIYIRADGSVDPDTAPILTVDNITYVFTDSINESIVVERDNIVVDGAGYTLQSPLPGWRRGINLWRKSNITIKNMEIKAFDHGIMLGESSNNSIFGNSIANNYVGIELEFSSSYNSISGNNITANNRGILLEHSPNNSVSGNSITANEDGIILCFSANNIIYHNNFVNNHYQVRSHFSTNIWDDGYPSGGNYWSDRVCNGNPSDGSQPYTIDADNKDHYPFQDPNGWLLPPPDETPPSIEVPSQEPHTPLDQAKVRVSMNVTDAESGVKNVTLWYRYRTVEGYTWCNLTMFYNATTQLFQATIPGFPGGALVCYKIVAYDNAGNFCVNDNMGAYYVYTVIYVIEGSEYLAICSSPTGVTFTVDGVSYVTSWSGRYSENASVSLVMPEIHTVGEARYYWNQWSDGNTSQSRIVPMITNITLTAQYTGPCFELTVASSPIAGVTFTIDGTPQTTPYTEWLPEDSYTLEMPETYNGYVWSHWLEDGDPNRTKTITLPGTTWTGVFVFAVQPHGPEAEFEAIPDTALTGESIKFDASSSSSGWNGTHEMPITEYRWDFGGAIKITTSTPIMYYSFISSGIYYVTLTVYTPGATPETDSTTKKVTITAIPVGGYSFPIKAYTTTKPLTLYLALIAILTVSFTIAKRRKKQQN